MNWVVALLLLLGIVGLGLSVWIVIPAPIFSLLPLSVGTPEISPGLMGLNTIAILLQILAFQFLRTSSFRVLFLALVFSTIALLFSSIPVLQFPSVNRQAEQTMIRTFGQDYLQHIPIELQSQWRSQPFQVVDVFRGIPQRPIREDRSIPFANPDGVPLVMNLYRPEKPGLYPAIVTIYGGAWQRGNPGQDAAFNRYIAAQGYVVWAISYRHAPTYQFPTQINDVRSALEFIQLHAAEYETDLTRLAFMGRSAGAQLASLAAYRDSPIRAKAMVNYYGPVDLTAGYYNIPTPDPIGSRSTLVKFLGGSPEDYGDRYRQASPIDTVKPGLPPTLLIYGDRDYIIRPQYGEHLTGALQATGNLAALIRIPWADHAFDAVFNGVSNQFALYYTERFLAWALYGTDTDR